MRWEPGRQGTGYYKLRLFEVRWPIAADCYVLWYPLFSWIPFHRDPVAAGFEHHRLNVLLQKPVDGGYFGCENKRTWWRFTLFRPDIEEHGVTRITGGERLVLSIGWLRRKR